MVRRPTSSVRALALRPASHLVGDVHGLVDLVAVAAGGLGAKRPQLDEIGRFRVLAAQNEIRLVRRELGEAIVSAGIVLRAHASAYFFADLCLSNASRTQPCTTS